MNIYRIISTVLCLFLIGMVVLFVIPQAFGITPLVVLSGSMEPSIPVGSAVYIKKVPENELKEGTIITWETASGILVTHRLIGQDGDLYITKGDANDIDDGAGIGYEDIRGKVMLSVPGLGRVAAFISTLYGKIVVLGCVPAILMFTKLEERFEVLVKQRETRGGAA